MSLNDYLAILIGIAFITDFASMAVTVTGKTGNKSKQDRNAKVLCICGCNRRLTSAQRSRHMKLLAPKFIAVNSAYRRAADLTYIRTGLAAGKNRCLRLLFEANVVLEESNHLAYLIEDRQTDDDRNALEDGMDTESDLVNDFGCRFGCFIPLSSFNHGVFTVMDDYPQATPNADNPAISGPILSQPIHCRDEYASSEDESDYIAEENTEDEAWADDDTLDDDPFGWALINDEFIEDGHGLAAEDQLGEDFEREAGNNGE